MPINVNSIERDWVEGETIAGLLKRMNFVYPMLVIKLNGAVIPKPRYQDTVIPDCATVEVIHLISGG